VVGLGWWWWVAAVLFSLHLQRWGAWLAMGQGWEREQKAGPVGSDQMLAGHGWRQVWW
jgi:hypothetical protein